MRVFFPILSVLILSGFSGFAQNYCTPPVVAPNYTGITNVHVNSVPPIDRASAFDDLYYYETGSAVFYANIEYSAQVLTHYTIPNTGFSNKLNTWIWIDYNRDGDFADQGELAVKWDLHNPGTTTAKFIIPSTASAGKSRMRVYTDMLEEDGHDKPTPCGYMNSSNFVGHHGEVEDYEITLSTATGVNAYVSQNADFLIYPNPSMDVVTISMKGHDETITLEVYDINGKMIRTSAFRSEMIVDLKDEKPGIYFVKLYSENFYSSKSFVKN